MGLPAGSCAVTGCCGSYLVVEADGGLYHCDFYALDQWRLGQIGETPLETIQAGARAEQFRAESRKKPASCADCRWQKLCGGCQRDWVVGAQGNENYLCPAFRQFFAYAEDRLCEIAAAERLSTVAF